MLLMLLQTLVAPSPRCSPASAWPAPFPPLRVKLGVFACGYAIIDRLYVGGTLVAAHSRLLAHDFPAVTRDVQTRVQAVRERVQQSTPGQ
jgi:hypothetical protein